MASEQIGMTSHSVSDGGISGIRRTFAFATVLVAFVLEVADSTIVNTALPAIRTALHADESEVQWIAAAYFLGLGSLLLIGGRLGDIYGYRRMFLIGTAGFVTASLACGLAATAEQLVAARLLQGAAGAVMAPQVMAIVQLLYSPVERIGRLAWFGVIGGLAAILGPILGGVLIDANPFGLGWRAIFLINLPVGIVALAAGCCLIPPLRSRKRLRLDLPGAALFACAFALLLGVLIQAPELGWSMACWLGLALSGLLFVAGWRHAGKRIAAVGSAVIEPALFRLRTFFWGLATVGAFSAASTGFLLIFAVALQEGLGLSPLATALRHVPFGIGVMAGISLIGRRYLPRFGRWLLVAGTLVMGIAVSLVLYRIAGGAADDWLLLALLFGAGLGMGMVAGPLPPIVVAHVDRAHAGSASAVLKSLQQIGGALGIAVAGGAYLSRAGTGAGGYLAALPAATAATGLFLLLALACALRLPSAIFAPADRTQ